MPLICSRKYAVLLSFAGMVANDGHEISGEAYAWTTVFLLTVNSALNPFLYTLSAVIAKKVVHLYCELYMYRVISSVASELSLGVVLIKRIESEIKFMLKLQIG